MSGVRLPTISIEDQHNQSKMSAGTYEPYQVLDALGKRGIGGNAKLKQVQADYRAKQNRSMNVAMPADHYRAGVSVSTISSLGFREVPVESFKAGDASVRHRFEKKRMTMIPT